MDPIFRIGHVPIVTSESSDAFLMPLNVTCWLTILPKLNQNRPKCYKPLGQWTSTDFILNACIYCTNNGGYYGPQITTPEEYETHVVSKHKGKPAYPGLADIKLNGLTHDGNGKSKVIFG